MSAFGVYPAPETVRFERDLPGPIDRVWAALTESDVRGRWLAAGPMEPRAGGSVTLTFDHGTFSPTQEEVPPKFKGGTFDMSGHVTRWEPPHVLAFTWGESLGLRSEVTFELMEMDGRVRLILTHRKLGDAPELLANVGAGWHTHLAILFAVLSEQAPPPFWSTFSDNERIYVELIAGAGEAPRHEGN